MKRERKIVVVLSLCLMCDFALQVFSTDVGRSPGRTALRLTQDILLIVAMLGVVALTIRILKVDGIGTWTVSAVLGFIAGTGVLLIDLFTHLENKQRIRAAYLGAALSHYDSRSVYLNRNRWMQVCGDSSGYEHITRGDLQLFDSMSRDTLGTIDEVLQHPPVSDQEPWRVRRALISACSEQAKLFEANWDEWHASGINPPQGEAKPWQKEAMRLQSEIDPLRKQDKELSPKVDEAFERWKSDSR